MDTPEKQTPAARSPAEEICRQLMGMPEVQKDAELDRLKWRDPLLYAQVKYAMEKLR
jgi:hypothetical protein